MNSFCPKCGRQKISSATGLIGYPDHRVAGSYVEYCGYCDDPPQMELSIDPSKGGKAIELERCTYHDAT